ncbi:arsenic resistance N-acetyltransferase ArsN2 [Natrinema salaciae]|uniref:Amino-acid N-acetyltransferase n=1 Tax=Natrinema salaciae TaxID=1186196 RepID=A0A1H9RDZ8_9EURY|nr:arsenic resistance N-acetyltransferase ArsN2 [Natrinema salaciae]SER70932.1 amino-acid N-acetyltransferase [Natrinema salaciae]
MTDASITLRDATAADLDRLEALLDANGLPTRDVRTKPECFFVAVSETAWIGIGGVELYGSHGLLRSVVVTEPNRGRGYGAALVDALEEYARANGVESLYLLTTTAAAFFRRAGYEAIERAAVPPRIQRTTEFAALCPASAICMKTALD